MNELQALTIELEAAKKDLARYERLTTAEARVEQLHADIAAFERKEQAREEAAHAAQFDGLSDIRVSPRGEGHVLSKSYTITWQAPGWDMWAGESIPHAEHSARSFGQLEPRILRFLIEKYPERIPPEIMALAPGDPDAAFYAYFLAKKRGHTTGPLSA